MTTLERSIPHNADDEAAVLGSILIEPEALYRVADALGGDDFYLDKHRAVWAAMVTISQRNEPVQLRALCDELERQGRLTEIGGPGYLTSLVGAVPTAAHAEYYAREVKRLAICRRAIFLASQMAAAFYESPANPEQVIGEMGTKLLRLTDAISRRNPDPGDIMLRLMGQDINRGIRLASPMLNYCTGGLQPSEFWVLGAFSSTGKTALALQWLREALDQGRRCAYFSLEMSQEQLMLRLLANYARVPMRTIRYREESAAEQRAVADAQATLAGMSGQFWLYDDVYSAEEIGYIARKHKLQSGLDVVFVDYLQNLRGRGDKKHEWLERACNDFLALAKQLDCCVVAMSQITTGEARLKDEDAYSFKDSGAIRDIADKAFMLSRDREGERDAQIGVLHCALKKNRTWGLIKQIDLCFEFATGRIWEPVHDR